MPCSPLRLARPIPLRRLIITCFSLGFLMSAIGVATAAQPTPRKKNAQATSNRIVAQATRASAAGSAARRTPSMAPLDLSELRMARLPTAGPEQLLAASLVFYGDHGCDGDRSLHVAESSQHAGYIDVSTSTGQWTMKPVQSASGALRLEDVRQVTLLVQISTKSMLLDTESGRRLLDNCVSAPQRLSRQDDGPTLGLAR